MSRSISFIESSELADIIQTDADVNNIVIIDVRDEDYYGGHIKNGYSLRHFSINYFN